jgi:hypothetical protein
MIKLSAKQVCHLKRIRAFVGEHPGCSLEEIYAGTGLTYGVQLLLDRNLLARAKRADGKQGYTVRPMGDFPEDKHRQLPHPDRCLLDEPGHEKVGCS